MFAGVHSTRKLFRRAIYDSWSNFQCIKIIIKHELRIFIPLSKVAKRGKKRKYISISILSSVCHKPEKQIKDFFQFRAARLQWWNTFWSVQLRSTTETWLRGATKENNDVESLFKGFVFQDASILSFLSFFLFFRWSFQYCYQTEVASLLCGIHVWFCNLLLWATSRHVVFFPP